MSGATGTRSLDRVSGEKSRCKTEARLVVSRPRVPPCIHRV